MTTEAALVPEPPHQQTQQETTQVPTLGAITYIQAGAGVPGSAPVLFLHGIGGLGRQWGPQVDAFAAAGVHALAWDMPGHGGSAPLALVTMDGLAATLGAFIATLGLQRPVLVGHSMGGMVAQRLLSAQPHAARALVLAQTSAAFGSRDPAWEDAFVRARLAPLDAGRSMADLAEGAMAELLGPTPDPAVAALARDCFAHVPGPAYRDTVLALRGFDARDALPHIGVPTLLLAGAHDTAAPPAGMERMASRIPGARLVVLPGAGHLAHLEQPDAWRAAVLGFVREVG